MDSIDSFVVYSYNLHGYNQGVVLLQDLCVSLTPQVIFIQEHWLSSINLNKLNTISTNYHCISSSAMEEIIHTGVLRGRPFGGIAILIRRDLADDITCLDSSDRHIIVKIGNAIFVNIYAPTVSKHYDRYSVTLQMLSNIHDVLSLRMPNDVVIFGGDFNTHMSDKNDVIAQLFYDFFQNNGIVLCEKSPKCILDYTFTNAAGSQRSCLDYLAVSKELIDATGPHICEIIDCEPNHSDHLPVRICLPVYKLCLYKPIPKTETHSQNNLGGKPIRQLRWDHADIFKYYSLTYEQLLPVKQFIDSLFESLPITNGKIGSFTDVERSIFIAAIEDVYTQITNILCASAHTCIPSVPKDFFKYWWDQELDTLKQLAISSHQEWVRQGRPKQGTVFENKKKHKYAYKNAINQKRKDGDNAFSNDLHEALLGKNQEGFWKMWKSKFPKKNSKIPNQVDGSTSHEEIANKFATYFADICKPNSSIKDDEFKATYSKLISDLPPGSDCCEYRFIVDNVDKAITDLKRGKAASLDGLTAEHLQACHPILVSILVKLFNMMLICEYVPDAFGNGLSIPLPKSLSGSLSCLEAYRCITVSPVISKVFEICLIDKLYNFFNTSNLQFGFKKKLSCSHAIYTLNTSVEYFTNNLSTVNICTIDLSKAFDKINVHCLLSKLLKRKVPVFFVKLIQCWYSKVFITVKWVTALSNCVKLFAGVRQGGILSPILFLIYVDDVLLALQRSKLGCVIKGFYVGVIMYADDIVLISPSVSDLQLMLNICFNELNEIDMCINVKKTMCTRIGNRFKNVCATLVISSKPLSWVNNVRYLGIFIVSGKSIKFDLSQAKRKFFVSCNSIFCKVDPRRADIVLPLISAFCLPILLYGLEAASLTKTEITRLEHPYTMVFHKIFGTYSKQIISQCQYYTGFLSLQYLYMLRQLCFFSRLKSLSADNVVCKHLFDRFASRRFMLLGAKFGVSVTDSVHSIKQKIWLEFCSHVEL